MKRFLPLEAFVLAVIILGCQNETTPTPEASHVYISGKVGTTSSNTVPVYWQDETLNYLPLSSGCTNGWAAGIAVDSSGSVYVSGGQWGATSMNGYWKDSTFFPLSLGSYTVCWYSGLAVDSAGNVWVTATVGNSVPPTTSVYWKNSGDPSLLPDCTNLWGLGADTLGNVYFMGTVGGTSINDPAPDYDWTPAYWKFGAGGMTGPTTLPLSGANTNGYAASVACDASGNFYTCGGQWSTTSGGPVYWKNSGNPNELSMGAFSAYASWGLGILALDASGKLYVVARIGPVDTPDTVVYWSGATSDTATLPLGGNAYWAVWNTAGAVDSEGNFFVVGSVGSSSSATIPVYWKNGGNYVQLSMGPGNSFGEAGSVATEP